MSDPPPKSPPALSYALPGTVRRFDDRIDIAVVVLGILQLLASAALVLLIWVSGSFVEGPVAAGIAFVVQRIAMGGFFVATVAVLAGGFRIPTARRPLYRAGLAGQIICLLLILVCFTILSDTTAYIRPPGPATLPAVAHDFVWQPPWDGYDRHPLRFIVATPLLVLFAVRWVLTKQISRPHPLPRPENN